MKVYKPHLPTGFLSRANGQQNNKPLTLIWERDETNTIKIDGITYNKSEVIERLSELNPIDNEKE
jgi:hypothetical protein